MKRNPPLPYEPISRAADIGGLLDFPLRSQRTEWTCGPACVSMVATHYGHRISEQTAIAEMGTTIKHGTVPQGMINLLSRFCVPKAREGMTKKQIIGLINNNRIPVVVLWDDWDGHWAVIIGADRDRVLLADPINRKSGMRLHTWDTFLAHWTTTVGRKTYTNFGIACYP